MAGTSSTAVDWETRYYAVAIRVSAMVALAALLAVFLAFPSEMEVKPYELTRSVEMVMEALPPELEQIAEPPKVERPQMPVAAESEEEVEAETAAETDFTEIIRRPIDTEIPVVPFWRVEVKPQPVSVPTPTYPEMARQAGIEGQAVVAAMVDIDGSVISAKILSSSGNQSLDQAAMEAAYKARFTPARQRDKPVRVEVSIPYRFTLN
ncbi:MAG: energy transducer TonB [bacterium]